MSSAAGSIRGKDFPQASAPAGRCACGSVPHAPYRWIQANGQDSIIYLITVMFLFLTILIIHILITLTDYLNNLSPDSKEYEDTQGTINMLHQQANSSQRLSSVPLRRALPASGCHCQIAGIYFSRNDHEVPFRFLVCNGNPPGSRVSSLLCDDCNV